MADGAKGNQHVASLDPIGLLDFLDHLRHSKGFNIGTNEYFAAQRMAELWAGRKGDALDRLQGMLAALLCSIPSDFKVFEAEFNLWKERILVEEEEPVEEEVLDNRTVDPIDVSGTTYTPPVDTLEEAVKKENTTRRRVWATGIGLSIIGLLAFVLLLENNTEPPATLRINSDPDSAKVWLNNTLLSETTPMVVDTLPAGQYIIRIRKEGFTYPPDTLSIYSGQDTLYEVVLITELDPDFSPFIIDSEEEEAEFVVDEWPSERSPHIMSNTAGEQFVFGHPADGLIILDKSLDRATRLSPLPDRGVWHRTSLVYLRSDSIYTARNIFRGHETNQDGDALVWSVGYSPDGSRIVSGGTDGTIRQWDSGTGQSIGEALRGHEADQDGDAWVMSVGYSPDGSRIVSGGADGTLRQWDSVTGLSIGEPLRGHEANQEGRVYVLSVSYSPDGSRIVSGGADGTVRQWESSTGLPIREALRGHEVNLIGNNFVMSVSYSPDGSRIVSGGSNGTIRQWDSGTGQSIGESLRGHELDRNGDASVSSVSYSPDGSRIVSGGADGTIRQWDSGTGQSIGEVLRGHEVNPKGYAWVRSVRYSADGSRIVSGGNDGTIRQWNSVTGQSIGEALRGHEADQDGNAWVMSVGYSPDGSRIVSGGVAGTVQQWEAQTDWAIGDALHGHEADSSGYTIVYSVNYSPDGSRIVSGGIDGTVRQWDSVTGQSIGEAIRGHEADQDGNAWVISVSYSSDGSRIVSGGTDGTIRQWDSGTGQPIGELMRGYESVEDVSYSPNGSRIVSGGIDGMIRQWDSGAGQSIGQPLRGHGTGIASSPWVRSVSYSPDGRRIVSGGRDGTIRQWDSGTGQSIGQPLRGHEVDQSGFADVWRVSYSPDGSRIVSGGSDGTIRQWDSGTGQSIGQPLRGHEVDQSGFADVWRVSYSPDGSRIVSGGRDGTIRQWDSGTGQFIGETLRGHEMGQGGDASVKSVSYSPDGSRIVSGGADGTIRQWWALQGWKPQDFTEFKPCVAQISGTLNEVRPDSVGLLLYNRRTNLVADTLRVTDQAVCASHIGYGNIAWAGADSLLHVWNYQDADSIEKTAKLDHIATGLAVWRNGDYFASAGLDSTVLIWSSDSLAVIDSVIVSGGNIISLAISQDGSQLVAVTADTSMVFADITPSKQATIYDWILGDRLGPLLSLLILALALIGLIWFRRYRSYRYLLRDKSKDAPEITNLYLEGLEKVLFPTLELYRVAQQMRLRKVAVTQDLHINKTVSETVKQAGMWTPVYRTRKITPEYLVLIDRSNVGDQQAAFIDNLLDQLESNQIITRYYFENDPRICFSDDPTKRPQSLYNLSRDYPNHRLLIFSEGYGFFNPITGNLAEWVNLIEGWSQRFLFVTTDEEQLSYRLPLLAEELVIFPASVQGLVDMKQHLEEESELPEKRKPASAPFPQLLLSRPYRWLEEDGPEQEEVDDMLNQVAAYLGPNGYKILAACAIYPDMFWKLTVNLAFKLQDSKGQTLLDINVLAAAGSPSLVPSKSYARLASASASEGPG